MGRWLFFGLGALFFMGLGGVVLALFLAGEIYEYQDSFDGAQLPRVDAIVCLAGGRGRIAAAGDVWYRYWEQSQHSGGRPPVLLISGVGPQSNWSVLEHTVRRGVLEVMKPEDVLLERESFNTHSNFEVLLRLAREKGWRSVLLVTSPYHMKRSLLIAERLTAAEKSALQVHTLSVYQEPFEPGEWFTSLQGIRVTLEEFAKYTFVKWAR